MSGAPAPDPSGSKSAFAAACVPDMTARRRPACPPARGRAGAVGPRAARAVIAGHRGYNTPHAAPGPPQNRANRRPERACSVTEGQNWRYPPRMTRNHPISPPAAPANRDITGEPAGPRGPDSRMTRNHRRQRHARRSKDPPEAKPNRETNRPRHRDMHGAGNLKTDGPQSRKRFRDKRSFHTNKASGDARCADGRLACLRGATFLLINGNARQAGALRHRPVSTFECIRGGGLAGRRSGPARCGRLAGPFCCALGAQSPVRAPADLAKIGRDGCGRRLARVTGRARCVSAGSRRWPAVVPAGA